MSNDWRSRVSLWQSDLTDLDCDAIVNAANSALVLGAGVAGAIARRGGPSIQAECDRLGPIALGEAAVTAGGRLKARYVIHAASMHPGGRASEDSLRLATRNSLKRAAEHLLDSVGFPALGTGIAGFPLERCAQVMLGEIREHLQKEQFPRRVELALFDAPALRVFQQTLETMTEA